MKKRLLALFMSLCLVVGLLPTAAWAAEDDWTECTDCSEDAPHMIYTAQDLDKIRTHTHTEDGVMTVTGYFKLANDITFSDADFAENGAFYNDGIGWIAIGLTKDDVGTAGAWCIKNFFTGTFDGAGFTISNLKVEHQSSCGLFGNIGETGVLKNLTIRNATFNTFLTETSYTAFGRDQGVFAFNSKGTIQNCKLEKGILKSGNGVAGGIVGQSTGLVDQCTVDDVKMDVFARSTVSSDNLGDKAALIAGIISGGTISNCTIKNSEIHAHSPYSRCIGGVAGYVKGNQNTLVISNCTVDNCTITGGERVGGIGGGVHSDGSYSVEIKDCKVINSNVQSDRLSGTLEANHLGITVTFENNLVSNTVYTNTDDKHPLTIQGKTVDTTVNGAKILGYDGQTVYVGDASAVDTIKLNSLSSNAYAVSNGGTFAAGTDFGATTLAVPSKAGVTFGGWYNNENFDGNAVIEATAGTIYYAKWKARELSSIEVTANKTNFAYGTVLSEDDFTVTAVYDNGDREKVNGYSILPDTALTVPGMVDVKVTYQEKEATCTINVAKATQTAPAAPELADRTYTSITLKAIEGAEYSCNGGEWKTSPEFTDLTAGTTYTFQIRYAETDTHAASDASEAAEFATLSYSSSGGGGGSSRNNSYAVSTPKADNGTVTVNNGASAKKGDTVTITVKPNEGYEIGTVTATDIKGNSITVTDKGDGKFSFVMPDSKVDVKATFVKSEVKPDQPSKTSFVDVPANSWYADAADFVAQRGLMSGVGENLFGGNQNTTRAMLMTILARMDGQDVTGGSTWYEKAMNWAKQTGVSDGTMPEVNITREQLATMLYSYAKLKSVDTTQGGMAVREFSDYDSISAWAGQSMTWAVNAGILSGRGNNTLAPTAGATRAEMAVMLQQFVGLMEK